MEQKNFIRNISGTVCFLGLALSTMSVNSTMVVDVNGNHEIPTAYYISYDKSSKTSLTKLEEESNTLFGEMRDATPEERASVNRYIKSISEDTGVNFFDIC